ncbi:hypothetical protein N7931_11550 [Catenovulum sp. 2E275]|uniref:hypothetical protein n=1 Tax=Catenovulum sp. 2E275 TaxID=2980497 RepID=UPI0021D2DD4D|nr:hypothetical protein [Catenovulum sp. 2E275]MCU4676264.1 hypothetical protein [Catenovulum sp. 2E275]
MVKFRLIVVVFSIFCIAFNGQAIAPMAFEKCPELHSDTNEHQTINQETHQDNQAETHDCCDVDCCDASCDCAQGACQSAVFIIEQERTSIQANAPNRLSLLPLVQLPSYSTLPFRPPI